MLPTYLIDRRELLPRIWMGLAIAPTARVLYVVAAITFFSSAGPVVARPPGMPPSVPSVPAVPAVPVTTVSH